MTKYGNIPCVWKGIAFRSKAERDHALFLEGEKQARRIEDWVYERKFPLYAWSHEKGRIQVCVHIPDFLVFKKDRLEVHEVKGVKTAAWSLKKKLFCANYPLYGYKVISAK